MKAVHVIAATLLVGAIALAFCAVTTLEFIASGPTDSIPAYALRLGS